MLWKKNTLKIYQQVPCEMPEPEDGITAFIYVTSKVALFIMALMKEKHP